MWNRLDSRQIPHNTAWSSDNIILNWARVNLPKEIFISHLINQFLCKKTTPARFFALILFSYVNFPSPVCGGLSLIHFSEEEIWLWALCVENQSSVSINLISKWPASLPLPLICSSWHASGPFVTQTASHMRLRLTLVHQERRMTHFATPLYNCRGLSVKLLQRGGMSENPVVKAEFKMSIGSDSSLSSLLCSLRFSLLNGPPITNTQKSKIITCRRWMYF